MRSCASSGATPSSSCVATMTLTSTHSAMADAAHPHVVLVGLSGTGKTSIGKLVAERLDMPFVDTDEGIGARSGRTVRELFEQEGEPRFRAIEAEVIAEVLSASAPTVVAAGGGAVVTPATRELLRAPATFCVW